MRDTEIKSVFLGSGGANLNAQIIEVTNLLKTPENRPYQLNFKKVHADYKKLNHGCVEEFAANYTYGFFMINTSIDSEVNREVFYIELINFINSNFKKVKGAMFK